MKKYFIISFLFLLAVTPVVAKGSSNTNSSASQTNNQSTNSPTTTTASQNKSTVTPSPKNTIKPTSNQVKNENQVQTQNQGEDQNLSVKTQENEQLNQIVDDNLTKVSDQVQELVDTVGTKTGIGQQVKEIAQNQTKVQENLKSNLAQLQLRSSLAKFFVGSDKKTLQNMEQQLEQNRLMIQQLEQLKTQTKNAGDLEQLQLTIDLMTYQGTSLQEKIDREVKINGLFGWLTNLFQK